MGTGKKSSSSKTTVNKAELEKFAKMAGQWWDPNGKFKPLHKFNPIRIAYIRNKVINHYNLDSDQIHAFKGLKLLDIGCGGGLLSYPMARLGADVLGIDAVADNIKVASAHQQEEDNFTENTKFQHTTVEELAQSGAQFDIILNMEVIEHVDNVPLFVQESAKMLKPGGIMFIATMNRTAKAYGLAIIGAEYILGWLPKGTHEWSKFIKPSELVEQAEASGLKLLELSGCTYNPFRDEWSLSSDLSVNYIACFSK
jgi:2-polyprenyl-6-hydroxyphenyl methylase/3-demethylubiquinone-9 3-methyltransferase